MSIKTFNQYSEAASSASHEILSTGATNKHEEEEYIDPRPERARDLLQDFFKQFFKGEKELWKTRKQPQILFRHLIRKHLYETWHISQTDIVEIEADVTGVVPERTNISYSCNQQIQLDYLYKKLILNFFKNKELPVSRKELEEKVLQKVKQAKANGYTTEDVARNCQVKVGTMDWFIRKPSECSYDLLVKIAQNFNIKIFEDNE